MIRTGPDGCLWMSDMYRFVIEHPEWIPGHQQRQLDLRAGDTMGRIYRIVPEDGPRPIPNLDSLDQNEVVDHLRSPNGTLRDMASQWLIWNGEGSVIVPRLLEMAQTSPNMLARIHALSVLENHPVRLLKPEHFSGIMHEAKPTFYPHVIQVLGKLAKDSPQARKQLLSLAKSSNLDLLMQAAYALGEWDSPERSCAP